MNYSLSIKYLYGLEPSGIKYNLVNIRRILKILGNPEKKLKTVHVAGTNGKGSVASLLNSVYTEAGYRCGLYTSPHVSDFRERIRINGRIIRRDYIAEFTSGMKKHFDSISPSFFEATTAMAFKYFADIGTDICFIETGLGGRLDSTNVLSPLLSVITGISIDHTEYLGSTIGSISREKAGIVKKNIPLVTGNLKQGPSKIINEVCRKKNSRVVNSRRNVKIFLRSMRKNGIYFDASVSGKKYAGLHYPLVGNFHLNNIRTALAVVDELQDKYPVAVSDLRNGFRNLKENSHYRYRFDAVSEKPYVIADVSHNKEGISNLKSCLKYFRYRKLFVIFGMMKDKDYISAVRSLEKLGGIMIFTKPSYVRSESPEVFLGYVRESSLSVAIPVVKDAVRLALCMAKKSDLILVTGSFFLVSDFLKAYRTLKK